MTQTWLKLSVALLCSKHFFFWLVQCKNSRTHTSMTQLYGIVYDVSKVKHWNGQPNENDSPFIYWYFDSLAWTSTHNQKKLEARFARPEPIWWMAMYEGTLITAIKFCAINLNYVSRTEWGNIATWNNSCSHTNCDHNYVLELRIDVRAFNED